MRVEFDNHRIISDEYQFIVQEKKITQEGKLTKAENIGKESWISIAYCPDVDLALKIIGKEIVLKNDDLVVIKEKLDRLHDQIKEFANLLK